MDEAIEHYQKALQIKPDNAEAHNNLGLVLAGHGRLDEAIAHYQRAVEIKPHFLEAHYNLGVALAGRGRIDEATAHYQKALVLAAQQNKAALVEELRARLRPDEPGTPHRRPQQPSPSQSPVP
jgi:Flp pilus assembly protein TadD